MLNCIKKVFEKNCTIFLSYESSDLCILVNICLVSLSFVFICALPFSNKYAIVYFHVLICYLYSFFELGNQNFSFFSVIEQCVFLLLSFESSFHTNTLSVIWLQIFLPICCISFIFVNTLLQKLEILINLSTYLLWFLKDTRL